MATIPAERLEQFIADAFRAVGIPTDDAATIAQVMTDIDLRGLDGHGIFRLPPTIQRIKAGGINVKPTITVKQETPSTAIIDGDNAVGHLAVNKAVQVAMDKAEQCGVAWVGTTNNNHAGAASIYAMMPLQRDMIGIYMAVGSANHLPPWGGTDMLLSTNPIACAIPGLEEPPIVLDMATTVASYGKVKMAADRGEIDVIFPTRRNLERLAQFDDFSEARAHAEATPMHTIVPFIEDGPQGRSLCIRGDCGYPVTSVLLDEAKRG